MFIELKDIIKKAANRKKMGKPLEAAHVCSLYRRLATQVFEEELLKMSAPLNFVRNVLTIKVSNSAAAQEIYFNKEKIIRLINKEIGNRAVHDIRTTIR